MLFTVLTAFNEILVKQSFGLNQVKFVKQSFGLNQVKYDRVKTRSWEGLHGHITVKTDQLVMNGTN